MMQELLTGEGKQSMIDAAFIKYTRRGILHEGLVSLTSSELVVSFAGA